LEQSPKKANWDFAEFVREETRGFWKQRKERVSPNLKLLYQTNHIQSEMWSNWELGRRMKRILHYMCPVLVSFGLII
jgi:hypothetical protein